MTPAPGHGRLRASHADRERVVDALGAAFVQGRLTQDELNARVGQALGARTYADLAALTADLPALTADLLALTADLPALTADLPAEPDRAPSPRPAPAPVPARPRNRSAKRAIKAGAGVIGAGILFTVGLGVVTGQALVAVVLPIFIVLCTAVATAFVAALIAVSLKAESRHRSRSRGQLPPGPESGTGGPAAPAPSSADPARPHRRRPPGSLVVGPASW